MAQESGRALMTVSLGELIITNPCLVDEKVNSIADDLRQGVIGLCDLFPLYVRCCDGGLYYVNDGNNRVQAMRDVGIDSREVIYVDFYFDD